jgi:hypothetical protein
MIAREGPADLYQIGVFQAVAEWGMGQAGV